MNRFEGKSDVQCIMSFALSFLNKCKDIEIQQHLFDLLAGVCLDNDMLFKMVNEVSLLKVVSQIIKNNLINNKMERFTDSTVSLLKVIFRTPQLFIEYHNLDFTNKQASQI